MLELMADGLDQPVIAKRLVISTRTVSKHIQHILEKLDVHSRAQAVAPAYLRGIRRSEPVAGWVEIRAAREKNPRT